MQLGVRGEGAGIIACRRRAAGVGCPRYESPAGARPQPGQTPAGALPAIDRRYHDGPDPLHGVTPT